MSIAALGGVSSAAAADAARGSGGTSGFGDISSEEFVRILVEELTNQDPLEPNDTQQVLEQLSSLRNIESQMSLQTSLESLVLQNGVAQAGGLIGKTVEGLDGNDAKVAGLVTAVRVVDGEAVLELDTGKQLPMDRVTRIVGGSAGGGGGGTASPSGVEALVA